MDHPNQARKIFERTRYKATEEDIKNLSDRMILLETRGLGKLNQRLIDGRRKIRDIFAEHNFAIILVSQHPSTTRISYEPDELSRPPDFKIEMGDITYWVQMKRPADLERESRQNKMIQEIKRVAEKIEVKKFFSCELLSDFNARNIPGLVEFIETKATSATEGERFLFTGGNNQKAEITFWSPNNVALTGLTLGWSGDIDIIEITGMNEEQIKKSLSNAVGAFERETDDKNINLIAMEADDKRDFNLCNAFFGTEQTVFDNRGLYWCRIDNGWFKDSVYSKKVAGIITLKRKQTATQEPIATYDMNLFMNDKFKHLLEPIKELLRIDRVVYSHMRPPMGHSSF